MSASDAGARVWITGHSGFTGRYLGAALEEAGYVPIAAAALPEFDLRDPDSIERELDRARPDYVIHLAGVTFVAHRNAAEFYEVNAVGTDRLLDGIARRARAVRKVIVASSANVYGNARTDPIDESVPPAPANHYACSKLAMEHMVRTWFDRLPILVVRPFNYTGVGQPAHFLVPKIVDHFARRAAVLKLGNLDVVRDFSDVRMVASAYRRLLETPLVGAEVNICSGIGHSLLSIVERLRGLSGHEPRIEVDPALVRASEVKRLVGSNRRLREAVGELPFADFGATLSWMFEEASQRTGSD